MGSRRTRKASVRRLLLIASSTLLTPCRRGSTAASSTDAPAHPALSPSLAHRMSGRSALRALPASAGLVATATSTDPHYSAVSSTAATNHTERIPRELAVAIAPVLARAVRWFYDCNGDGDHRWYRAVGGYTDRLCWHPSARCRVRCTSPPLWSLFGPASVCSGDRRRHPR